MEPPPPFFGKYEMERNKKIKCEIEGRGILRTIHFSPRFRVFMISEFEFFFNLIFVCFCLSRFVGWVWPPPPLSKRMICDECFFFFCWKRCSIISSIFWSNILFTKVLNDIGYDFNLGPISNFFNLILHVLTTMKIAQSKKKKK